MAMNVLRVALRMCMRPQCLAVRSPCMKACSFFAFAIPPIHLASCSRLHSLSSRKLETFCSSPRMLLTVTPGSLRRMSRREAEIGGLALLLRQTASRAHVHCAGDSLSLEKIAEICH